MPTNVDSHKQPLKVSMGHVRVKFAVVRLAVALRIVVSAHEESRNRKLIFELQHVVQITKCTIPLIWSPYCMSLMVSEARKAKHQQVKTKIFSPHSRCVPTYGLPQTGLWNKVWAKVWYAICCTWRSVLLAVHCYKVQFGTIHTYVRTVSVAKRFWLLHFRTSYSSTEHAHVTVMSY